MAHFAVIQSIVRAGFAGDREAFDKQVVRLRERLEKSGDLKDAATLERFRAAARDTQEIAPSRVETSRALIVGEVLEPGVSPPIDRETGAKLSTISFPDKNNSSPSMRRALAKRSRDCSRSR